MTIPNRERGRVRRARRRDRRARHRWLPSRAWTGRRFTSRNRDHDRVHAVVAGRSRFPGHDDELVDRRRLRRRSASRPSRVACAPSSTIGRGHRGGVERPARLRDGERAGTLARRDRARGSGRVARRFRTSRTAGTNWVTVASNGPGAIDATDLLGEDAGFDHAEPDAAVDLGDGQRRPAQAGERRPERVGTHAVVADPTGQPDRALPAEHRANRVAQLFLIRSEFQLHDGGVRLGAGRSVPPTPGGRPSRRR